MLRMRISTTKMKVHVLHPNVRSCVAIAPPSNVSHDLSWLHALTFFLLEMPKRAYAGHQPTSPVTSAIVPMTSETMLVVPGQVIQAAYARAIAARILIARSHAASLMNVMTGLPVFRSISRNCHTSRLAVVDTCARPIHSFDPVRRTMKQHENLAITVGFSRYGQAHSSLSLHRSRSKAGTSLASLTPYGRCRAFAPSAAGGDRGYKRGESESRSRRSPGCLPESVLHVRFTCRCVISLRNNGTPSWMRSHVSTGMNA